MQEYNQSGSIPGIGPLTVTYASTFQTFQDPSFLHLFLFPDYTSSFKRVQLIFTLQNFVCARCGAMFHLVCKTGPPVRAQCLPTIFVEINHLLSIEI